MPLCAWPDKNAVDQPCQPRENTESRSTFSTGALGTCHTVLRVKCHNVKFRSSLSDRCHLETCFRRGGAINPSSHLLVVSAQRHMASCSRFSLDKPEDPDCAPVLVDVRNGTPNHSVCQLTPVCTTCVSQIWCGDSQYAHFDRLGMIGRTSPCLPVQHHCLVGPASCVKIGGVIERRSLSRSKAMRQVQRVSTGLSFLVSQL